jgi:hypothetical protein
MDNGNEHMRLNVRPACRGRLAASVFFSIFLQNNNNKCVVFKGQLILIVIKYTHKSTNI